jgi:CheY-like chemotaxis protein
MPAKVILVADSDAFSRELLSSILTRSGYRVILVATAREAVETANLEKPDLILFDVAMPDMDGFEASRLLRQSPATETIPLLLMEAAAESGAQEKALLAGAEGSISKAAMSGELVSRLNRLFWPLEAEKATDTVTSLSQYRAFLSQTARLISKNEPLALLAVKLVGFRALSPKDKESALRLGAMVIREALAIQGKPSDMASYQDRGNFLVVTSPYRASALCRRILARFQSLAASFLTPQTSLSLVIGGVTNLHRGFKSVKEIIQLAGRAGKYARRRGLGHYLASWERSLLGEAVPPPPPAPFRGVRLQGD